MSIDLTVSLLNEKANVDSLPYNDQCVIAFAHRISALLKIKSVDFLLTPEEVLSLLNNKNITEELVKKVENLLRNEQGNWSETKVVLDKVF